MKCEVRDRDPDTIHVGLEWFTKTINKVAALEKECAEWQRVANKFTQWSFDCTPAELEELIDSLYARLEEFRALATETE